MKFEMFFDPAYYDMWCVRPVGSKDFNETLHFDSQKQAQHAMALLEKWMKNDT